MNRDTTEFLMAAGLVLSLLGAIIGQAWVAGKGGCRCVGMAQVKPVPGGLILDKMYPNNP